MDCGKTVAYPARATPCNDSFHQLYSGILQDVRWQEKIDQLTYFSSTVILDTKSFTRCSIGRFGFLNGKFCCAKVVIVISVMINTRECFFSHSFFEIRYLGYFFLPAIWCFYAGFCFL